VIPLVSPILILFQVELWGKEAPKAVRNFLALTMEGQTIPDSTTLELISDRLL